MESHALFPVTNVPVPASLIGFNKVASMFELCHMGLPILDTIVVTRWTDEDAKEMVSYIALRGWPQVMVRSDQNPETPNSPRGGRLFELNTLSSVVANILSAGRIAILMEPANKYDNLYGVNVLLESHTGQALLEIVGPGFDATDLNRGDISPHESICLHIKDDVVTCHVAQRSTISHDEYIETVRQRLSKIGREAIKHGAISCHNLATESLEEMGLRYLRSAGCTLLNPAEYRQFPRQFLVRLVSHIRDLPWMLRASKEDTEYIISASALNSARPKFVFWDIVRPSTKYGFGQRNRP